MEKEMNEIKALEIIENMISGAKRDIQDNGFYYMFWGYLVFVAALIDYVLLMQANKFHALVWAIMMPLGGITTAILSIRNKKKQRVVTYVDEVLKHILTAYAISLFLVCLIMPMTGNNWRSFFPTLMVLYAFCLYAMGGIIQFRPIQYGAIVVWLIAAAAFFVQYNWQLLLLANAVLFGFIIPGHLLNNRFRKQHV